MMLIPGRIFSLFKRTSRIGCYKFHVYFWIAHGACTPRELKRGMRKIWNQVAQQTWWPQAKAFTTLHASNHRKWTNRRKQRTLWDIVSKALKKLVESLFPIEATHAIVVNQIEGQCRPINGWGAWVSVQSCILCPVPHSFPPKRKRVVQPYNRTLVHPLPPTAM